MNTLGTYETLWVFRNVLFINHISDIFLFIFIAPNIQRILIAAPVYTFYLNSNVDASSNQIMAFW